MKKIPAHLRRKLSRRELSKFYPHLRSKPGGSPPDKKMRPDATNAEAAEETTIMKELRGDHSTHKVRR